MNDLKAQAAYHPQQPHGENMTTNQERAAQVIGQAYEQAMDSMVPSAWKGHIARALAEHEPPLLAPDLPRPDHQDDRFTVWLLDGDVGVKVNPKGAVIIEHVDVGWFALPPEKASAFADMIKAAAMKASEVAR